jgi:hypothetical protein
MKTKENDIMNLKNDIKMLWDNKQLIEARKLGFILTFLLLIVNVSMISIPNFFGLLNGLRDIDQLVGIETTFRAMYDDALPCSVSETFTMECVGNVDGTYGNYRIVYQEEIVTENINEPTIFFGYRNFTMIYINENNKAFIVAGDYRLLSGFSFAEVNSANHEFDTLEDYQDRVTDVFISGIYNSTIGEKVFLIFSSQFAQIVIYIVIISFMFMILNFRSKIRKITFPASLKIVIVSMTGPALITAILGIFFRGWASVLFTILFAIRVMFVYYEIHRAKETII